MATANTKFTLEVPNDLKHLNQYFGVWNCEPSALHGFEQSVKTLDWQQHLAARETTSKSTIGGYQNQNGIAVLNCVGLMTKYGSSMSEMEYGTIGLRASLRRAVRDDTIAGIVIRFDTPGGTVSGLDDFARDVRKAAQIKPVIAYCEDLCASAGYYAASQCTKVIANTTAMIGCIGTYTVIHDTSAAFTAQGITTHVIATGEYKGMGEPGTEITDAHLSYLREEIDAYFAHFRNAVQTGRGMSGTAFDAIADGRCWMSETALFLGLIDSIGEWGDALAAARPSPATPNATTEISTMNEASYEDIKAMCPGADAAFICQQLEAKATIDQAQTAWMEEQQARIDAAQAEARQAREDALKAKTKPGVEPIEDGKATSETEAEGATYETLVRQLVSNGMPEHQAARKIARDYPDETQDYVRRHNAVHTDHFNVNAHRI